MTGILSESAPGAVLLNALLIFLSLVFCTAVSAVVAYQVRLIKPSANALSAKPPISDAMEGTARKLEPFLTAHELENIDCSLGWDICKPVRLSKPNPEHETQKGSEHLAITTPSGYSLGRNPSDLSTSSPPRHIDLIQKDTSVLLLRPRYTDSELRCLHLVRQFEPGATLKLTRLLQFERCFPEPRFDTVRSATYAVHEVEIALQEQCQCSKALGLFQLAAMGGSWKIYDNPIYFHEQFCSLLEQQIDTADWLMASKSSEELQIAFMDLMVCFSWCHWNWCLEKGEICCAAAQSPDHSVAERLHDSIPRVVDYFDRAGLKPFLFPRRAIFRLLAKLHLTTPHWAPMGHSVAKVKLDSVFRVCAMNTECFEHRMLLPLVSQSVSCAENDRIKEYFYSIAVEIVSPHLNCCVEVQDVFYPKSDLQSLVLLGLWIGQPLAVRVKATYLARLLGKKFPEVNLWCEPIRLDASAPDRPQVPGSWMNAVM